MLKLKIIQQTCLEDDKDLSESDDEKEIKEPQIKESEIQRFLETKYGGGHKSCPAGTPDIVTDKHLIEIKKWNNWKGAMGQLLGYSKYFPNREMIAYFFGYKPPEEKYINIIDTLKDNKINVLTYESETEEEVSMEERIVVEYLTWLWGWGEVICYDGALYYGHSELWTYLSIPFYLEETYNVSQLRCFRRDPFTGYSKEEIDDIMRFYLRSYGERMCKGINVWDETKAEYCQHIVHISRFGEKASNKEGYTLIDFKRKQRIWLTPYYTVLDQDDYSNLSNIDLTKEVTLTERKEFGEKISLRITSGLSKVKKFLRSCLSKYSKRYKVLYYTDGDNPKEFASDIYNILEDLLKDKVMSLHSEDCFMGERFERDLWGQYCHDDRCIHPKDLTKDIKEHNPRVVIIKDYELYIKYATILAEAKINVICSVMTTNNRIAHKSDVSFDPKQESIKTSAEYIDWIMNN